MSFGGDVGPFYLVSIPGEVKDPTRGKGVTCRGLQNSEIKNTPALALEWAVWSMPALG